MGDRAWKVAPRRRAPTATLVLVVVTCAFFLVTWVPQTGRAWADFAAFTGLSPKVWTLVTYTLVESRFFGILFGMMWLYWVGSVVESRLGRTGFVVLYLASAASMALFGGVAATVTGKPIVVAGAYPPIDALTVVWGALHMDEEIRLYGVLPIKGKWMAAASAGFILFYYGLGNPLVGVAMCLPLLFLWFYARGSLKWMPFGVNPFTARRAKQAENRQFQAFMDDVRSREKEREERERLRKLFESSLDDPDDKR